MDFLRRPVLFLSSVAVAASLALGCKPVCDCPPDVVGLVLDTSQPVTDVELQGPACSGGRFRCVPQDFDSTIHGACMQVQVEAVAEGHCIVRLEIGGVQMAVDRVMSRRPSGCCGGYIGEAYHQGEIDLRQNLDAGPFIDAPADI